MRTAQKPIFVGFFVKDLKKKRDTLEKGWTKIDFCLPLYPSNLQKFPPTSHIFLTIFKLFRDIFFRKFFSPKKFFFRNLKL
ncbi:MAG: hypothetical protein [Circoviridae sp.]|nr:MAG: hypothetical protein [Circoviridae sp.]